MINPKHNIESAFVLVLFAVFAVAIVAVLALGARTYKGLVERDNDSYNKRIITSYVSAKIRNNDVQGGGSGRRFRQCGRRRRNQYAAYVSGHRGGNLRFACLLL